MLKTALDPKHFDALRKFKAGIFKVLAHPTRIHIIEALRTQHLSVLRHSHLVLTRKDGNQVLYSLRDPLLVEVLDAMRQYFHRHFEDSIQMLKQMERSR
jgi:DNA-binding transcriptional ArsR family regulator